LTVATASRRPRYRQVIALSVDRIKASPGPARQRPSLLVGRDDGWYRHRILAMPAHALLAVTPATATANDADGGRARAAGA
jgi:hypothetical protein